MNSVNLIGRLTAEPLMGSYGKTREKTAIAKFTVAIDRPGKKDEADFVRCTAFGRTAEFAEDHLSKGERVGVSGRLQTGSYENDKGDRVYTMEVIVDQITFADGKRQEADERPAPKRKTRDAERPRKKPADYYEDEE